MRTIFISVLFLVISVFSFGDEVRVEPPFWWVGMESEELQLMVSGKNIAECEVDIYSDMVEILALHKGESKNYLFIDLRIKKNQPGAFEVLFKNADNRNIKIKYDLKERTWKKEEYKGFDSSDVIYLITPDRFANGDDGNDKVSGFVDEVNRKNPRKRHGGDIKGIRKHLDYIKEMGFTQIWLQPVLESKGKGSYHGYAISDYYAVDPRYGSNEEYRLLSYEAREKGVGIIKDFVLNHCNVQHLWIQDPPFENWFNNTPKNYVKTNHEMRVSKLDPNGSERDRKKFGESSFVKSMPDLNQRNPFLAKYLIQNAIWWIEYAKLSGIRVDTYSYSDKQFLSEWTRRIMEEYPNFNIVGEEWINTPAIIAYWLKDKVNTDGYVSYLPTVMDFPVSEAVKQSFMMNGFRPLYDALRMDFVYPNPKGLVVFADNHDMDRVFRYLNGDFDAFKMIMSFFMTVRGVPQIFYGTEILKTHNKLHDHPTIRSDFPGGWNGDKVNAFTGIGLSAQEKEAQNFMKSLLNWRKSSVLVHEGDMKHFFPHEGVYIYGRYIEGNPNKVVVLMNITHQEKSISINDYRELFENAEVYKLPLEDKHYFSLGDRLSIPPRKTLILEIK